MSINNANIGSSTDSTLNNLQSLPLVNIDGLSTTTAKPIFTTTTGEYKFYSIYNTSASTYNWGYLSAVGMKMYANTPNSLNSVTLVAPAIVTSSYTLTYPGALPASAGSALTSNTSGTYTWQIVSLKAGGAGAQYSTVYWNAAGELTDVGVLNSGQIIVGSTGAAPVPSTLTGTNVSVTAGAGTLAISIPQSVATVASPTFAGLTLTGFSGVVKSSAGILSASTIVNNDISASAAIGREKLAAGSASHVLINSVTGLESSEAFLDRTRGGTGISSTATFPASGTVALVPASGVVKSNGTALSVSNVALTSEVTGTLPVANGGTNLTTYAAGDLLYAPSINTVGKLAIGTDGQYLKLVTGLPTWSSAAGLGDVFGPASSTDNAVARFDATTGKLLQNSVVTIGDTGIVAGVDALNINAAATLGSAGLVAPHTLQRASGGGTTPLLILNQIDIGGGRNNLIAFQEAGTTYFSVGQERSVSADFLIKNATTAIFNLTSGGTLTLTGGLSATTGTFSSTLGVTGSSTLNALSATTIASSGLSTLNSLTVTNASTLAAVTGTTGSFSSTFNATGATTLGSTLSVAGAITIPSTSYFKGNATNGFRFNNAADTNTFLTIADSGVVTIGPTVGSTSLTHIIQSGGVTESQLNVRGSSTDNGLYLTSFNGSNGTISSGMKRTAGAWQGRSTGYGAIEWNTDGSFLFYQGATTVGGAIATPTTVGGIVNGGAWTLGTFTSGASLTTNHYLNGTLNVGGNTTTDQSKALWLGANVYNSAYASAARTLSTGGAALLMMGRNVNTTAAVQFHTNLTADTTTPATSNLIATATQEGCWQFGPSSAIGGITYAGNNIVGRTSSASVPVGYVGQMIGSTTGVESGGVSSTTALNLHTITLTAGIWAFYATVCPINSASFRMTFADAFISSSITPSTSAAASTIHRSIRMFGRDVANLESASGSTTAIIQVTAATEAWYLHGQFSGWVSGTGVFRSSFYAIRIA